MSLNLTQRLANSSDKFHIALKDHSCGLRVAIPGIIQAFDPTTQTVTVQPAITESMLDANNVPTPVTLPLLSKVPIVLPRAGNFVLTLPVQQGDECLVIFADACIDAWWQAGGTQNQIELRRHDLSDGFAILGPWSQQRLVSGYSTTAAQLRSDDGQTVIEVGSGEVTIKANNVTVQAAQQVTINGTSGVKINGTDWQSHTHSGIQSGGSISGPVAS